MISIDMMISTSVRFCENAHPELKSKDEVLVVRHAHYERLRKTVSSRIIVSVFCLFGMTSHLFLASAQGMFYQKAGGIELLRMNLAKKNFHLKSTPVTMDSQTIPTHLALGELMAIPNGSKPFPLRVSPGVLTAEHNANAFKWIRSDNAGVVIRFEMQFSDTISPVKATFNIFGNNVFFKPIISAKNADLFLGHTVLNPYVRCVDFYWNGYDKHGRTIPGIYTAKVIIEQGSEKRQSSVDIMIGRISEYVSDISGCPIEPESNCGNGFILAFLPPMGFKLGLVCRRKRMKKKA